MSDNIFINHLNHIHGNFLTDLLVKITLMNNFAGPTTRRYEESFGVKSDQMTQWHRFIGCKSHQSWLLIKHSTELNSMFYQGKMTEAESWLCQHLYDGNKSSLIGPWWERERERSWFQFSPVEDITLVHHCHHCLHETQFYGCLTYKGVSKNLRS